MLELEKKLDSFDEQERLSALSELKAMADRGEIELPDFSKDTNVHFHTFYSYNGEGYSPSKIAWLARKAGLGCVGCVDFDVFDAVDEFHKAAAMLGLKASAGMETRVFVPEFADKVINSPGEPGVAYHMGTGFPCQDVPVAQEAFKDSLKQTAQQRNKGLLERVNAFLSPVELDLEGDVFPLTPAGNATERHICLAYAKKAEAMFGDTAELAKFWSEKLGVDAGELDLPSGAKLQATIRSKTMKRGGVGYVQPGPDSFTKMEDVNKFVLECGGIPTLAWLDGTSDGEQCIEELIEIAMKSGVAAFNIIPDRNYTAGLGEKDVKCKNLYHVIDVVKKYKLPVIAGTEMNSPGQKFVDDFASAELAPLRDTFYHGALVVYAHTLLQRYGGMGYVSEWAKDSFASVDEKNDFFYEIGELACPANENLLDGIDVSMKPEDVKAKITKA